MERWKLLGRLAPVRDERFKREELSALAASWGKYSQDNTRQDTSSANSRLHNTYREINKQSHLSHGMEEVT